jgi:hypothetical protein
MGSNEPEKKAAGICGFDASVDETSWLVMGWSSFDSAGLNQAGSVKNWLCSNYSSCLCRIDFAQARQPGDWNCRRSIGRRWCSRPPAVADSDPDFARRWFDQAAAVVKA